MTTTGQTRTSSRRETKAETKTGPGVETPTGTMSGSEGDGGGRRRPGLGRGLAALIPTTQDEAPEAGARPLDILFPARPDAPAGVTRGGSARDLLNPRTSRPSSGRRPSSQDLGSNVSRETSHRDVDEPVAPVDGSTVPSATESDDLSTEELLAVPGATFGEIPLEWIIPNTRQPREVFDQDDLDELAASVAEVGVLQPIVVRPISTLESPSQRLKDALEERPEARYELIMGERRLRASEMAGLGSIPAIVRRTENQDLLRDALLENLHRAQLNPLEEASAYQQLMADFGATQEELSKRIARSRPQIANTLRLLKLPPAVQRKVAAGVISAGHARALLALPGTPEMEILSDRIVSEGLSVRTTEELVRLGLGRTEPKSRTREPRPMSPIGERVVSRLMEAYDTRVTITEGRNKGKIIIEFAGPDDLERLAGIIAPEK